jgi:energy-coupling factor transporter ATP-binding protein EcfA2
MSGARPYPGSRWWKFDFHTHTPASKDWKGGPQTSAEEWLLSFTRADIDCVVVTDHNSGAWIDRLKAANAALAAGAGSAPAGYRKLTVFPGVEISAQGGVHVLAVFGPDATSSDIDSLLGSVGFRGTKGDSDDVTQRGLGEVLQLVLAARAIPIPAHADQPKGLLECLPGHDGAVSRRSRVDPQTLRQAVQAAQLLAVEWCDSALLPPQEVEKQVARLARVVGSDSHGDPAHHLPGSRFTWMKMAEPTLEGLRLALLDGNGVSIQRSDDGAFDPLQLPNHRIAAIEVERTRYMGNGRVTRMELSPYFSAVVGGRGSGKSTIVHALRLAMGRGFELVEGSDARVQFDAFKKVVKSRSGGGALRDESVVRVEWLDADTLFRLTWSTNAPVVVEELRGNTWHATASQAVHTGRFPIRILSQGQLAHLAGEGRRTLLGIIDEAASVGPLQAEFQEAIRTFKAQRAQLRELEGRLAEQPEVERRLNDTERKLQTFSSNNHVIVLRDVAQTNNQLRGIQSVIAQANEISKRISALAGDIALDDWAPQLFDADTNALAWRRDVDAAMVELRGRLQAEVDGLRKSAEAWWQDPRLTALAHRHQSAHAAYAELQQRLSASGVEDLGAFERLTRERHALEQRVRELDRLKQDRTALLTALEGQFALIRARRLAVTAARKAFISRVLHGNPHVQMSIAEHGCDARQVEREIRDLLGVEDSFAIDILSTDGDAERGLAVDLANATAKLDAIDAFRRKVLSVDAGFNGHFRNHLAKKVAEPEFADRVHVWWPEDDLRIDYQRAGKWAPIEQGSQGQRSAALLAFLLAFGEEPIVLDQPEDDLDNHLIYDLIVRQIRENKRRRQMIIVTHNPNVVVNGDAEFVQVMGFAGGQCVIKEQGALQDDAVREEVCRVMEGGREAFERRWKRLGGQG